MQIFSTIIASPIGQIEIKATKEHILSILFTEDNIGFEHQQKLPSVLSVCTKELSAYFAGNLKKFTVPILFEGTVFQQKVWHSLTTIPYGRTISYLQLSKQIGDVKAIRAVGTTNGKNQLSIVVPCHRVIGSNGSLTGYSGGLWRKKWLLNHEATIANGLTSLF
jgi:methylated-DNA-[protein]-cysteine S-methyltransferase